MNNKLIIVILSVIIAVLFFNINEAVWWDEAEYLNYARSISRNTPSETWEGRTLTYSILLSPLYRITTNEAIIRLVLIFTIVLVNYYTYELIKKLFNKKISIITCLFLTFNPLMIFFSHRFLTSIPSLLFALIGLNYYFKQDAGYKSQLLTGLFLGLSITIRFTSVFLIPPLILYTIIKHKKRFRKYVWIPILLSGFIPMLLVNASLVNSFFTFIIQSTKERTTGHNLGGVFYYIKRLPFILGAQHTILFSLMITSLIIGTIVLIKKMKLKCLTLLSYSLIHFITYSTLTPLKEARYMIPILPFTYAVISVGLYNVVKYVLNGLNTNNKRFNNILVFFILLIFVFVNFTTARELVNSKKTSYKMVKKAGLWIRERTDSNSLVCSNAGPQANYYTSRKVKGLLNDSCHFYLISFYERVPSEARVYFNDSSDYRIVKVFPKRGKTKAAVLLKE